MSQIDSNADKIVKVFKDYCGNKNYQVQQSEEPNNLRLDISNFSERTIVRIFHSTGTVQIQGKQNLLKAEMENMKAQYEENHWSFLEDKVLENKACETRYDLMLPELRTEIKESLNMLEGTVCITENPDPNREYRAKINRNHFSITLTQHNNGTLLLQGKTGKLFDDSCDLIEEIANPSDKEVVARFISGDDENLRIFTGRYTPDLIVTAEDNVKEKIGDVFNYLESHDQKWFVASECLCLTEIPLPEFSPLVMPASKAFEGFAKKLLVDIGLFEPDHFKNKKANFSSLNDKNNPKRKAVCKKEKYVETYLDMIIVDLDRFRNFMFHSDDSKVTKVETLKDATKMVNKIFEETKEIFEYFNDQFTIHLRSD